MKEIRITLYETIRHILSFGIFEKPIAAELAATKNETVLDFGCGTGAYSKIVPGRYIGIDIDGNLISYACKQYTQPNRTFLRGSLQELIRKKSISSVDKAIFVNVLHHLSDQDVSTNLKILSRITKKRVIIVDMDKAGSNWWQKFFFLFDSGQFIRSQAKLRDLIINHFRIKKSFIYYPPTLTIRLCLFHCLPKKSARI